MYRCLHVCPVQLIPAVAKAWRVLAEVVAVVEKTVGTLA